MNRPDQDTYFMRMAFLAASRGNCYRRQVGCVLVDNKNRVLSTGYNGVPSGFPHCEEGQCPREEQGHGNALQICVAIHGEMNALLQCPDCDKVKKAYITTSPCLNCTVVLLNTSCEEVIFSELYPGHEQSKIIWESTGRLWTPFKGETK